MSPSCLLNATRFVVGLGCLAATAACSSSGGSGFGGTDGGADGRIGQLGPDGSIIGRDAQILGGGKDSGHADVKIGVSKEAGFSDAMVEVDANGCLEDAGPAGPGPLQHTCIIYPVGMDDGNECDGNHDPPAPFPKNGSTGNGFDDNCNGLVDEGCSCTDVGTTKPCYLVPATQTQGGLPVGWCATNSVGTVACSQQGEGSPTWSGVCRGAQPPYANDVCAPGDFNCDGKPENPTGESCACKTAVITCPTAPVTTAPYPPPTALPLEINAASWFSDPSQVAQATNWLWTMTGGDCDNILPYPTFGLYPTNNGSGVPVGTTSTTLGMNGLEHGWTTTGSTVTSSVYPAFALSGDYVLEASWTLNGTNYSCTVQIDVRAPGLRAEACWSTEGQGDDLDLHMAKVNGFTSSCPSTEGWSDIECATADQDCYYRECYAGAGFTDSVTPKWGFTTSATGCKGWGSQTTGACGNPRLDRDANGLSGACSAATKNPNNNSQIGGYCGPENINVDEPNDGDQYAVGVRFYTKNSPTGTNAKTHADIYCNGVRIFAGGYDPVAGTNYPQLITDGADGDSSMGEGGDMWKVALVTTTVTGGTLSCTVVPTQSQTADATRDGTTAYCVDNATLNTAQSQELLTSGGGVPASANALCFH